MRLDARIGGTVTVAQPPAGLPAVRGPRQGCEGVPRGMEAQERDRCAGRGAVLVKREQRDRLGCCFLVWTP